jgi:hypothetical protein
VRLIEKNASEVAVELLSRRARVDNGNIGIPGIDRPFRIPSRQRPPDEAVLTFMTGSRFTVSGDLDCSEIAERLYNMSRTGALVWFAHLDYRWPERASGVSQHPFGPMISIPELKNGRIMTDDYVYHAVYSDGRYVYDPRLSANAIAKSDYSRLIRELNPRTLSTRYSLGYGTLHKGEYSR